jgi:hypothetical protein
MSARDVGRQALSKAKQRLGGEFLEFIFLIQQQADA